MLDPKYFVFIDYVICDDDGWTNELREDAPEEAKKLFEEYKKLKKHYEKEGIRI